MEWISFLVAFLACVIGKMCGMGGGVIIKPALDAIGGLDRAAINFVSGCTVLGMSCWSVAKSFAGGRSEIDVRRTTPLAVGAAVGGIAGKSLYNAVSTAMPTPDIASGVQAVVLLALTALTLFYTMKKDAIPAFSVKAPLLTAVIGLALGMLGAFLGIGGGPFNMAVLYLFFSMTTKVAVQNSLYVILFSQLLSLVWTALQGRIPPVNLFFLAAMVLAGVAGSEAGGKLGKRISEAKTTVLFEFSMVLVMGINLYVIVTCLF